MPNANKINQLKDLGIDVYDYSWVENELATSDLERDWFKFQRESGANFGDNWDSAISNFSAKSNFPITVDQAVAMTKKWKRYLMGSWFTLASHNPNKVDWKDAARRFERYHREIEERMVQWSLSKKDVFPTVKTKQQVLFWHGPYFNQCIERIPHLFADVRCSQLKTDVVLRVVAYDSQTQFIRLDFTRDIRKIIKPNENEQMKPWHNYKADYAIRIMPTEINTHLEILEPL